MYSPVHLLLVITNPGPHDTHLYEPRVLIHPWPGHCRGSSHSFTSETHTHMYVYYQIPFIWCFWSNQSYPKLIDKIWWVLVRKSVCQTLYQYFQGYYKNINIPPLIHFVLLESLSECCSYEYYVFPDYSMTNYFPVFNIKKGWCSLAKFKVNPHNFTWCVKTFYWPENSC